MSLIVTAKVCMLGFTIPEVIFYKSVIQHIRLHVNTPSEKYLNSVPGVMAVHGMFDLYLSRPQGFHMEKPTDESKLQSQQVRPGGVRASEAPRP